MSAESSVCVIFFFLYVRLVLIFLTCGRELPRGLSLPLHANIWSHPQQDSTDTHSLHFADITYIFLGRYHGHECQCYYTVPRHKILMCCLQFNVMALVRSETLFIYGLGCAYPKDQNLLTAPCLTTNPPSLKIYTTTVYSVTEKQLPVVMVSFHVHYTQ